MTTIRDLSDFEQLPFESAWEGRSWNSSSLFTPGDYEVEVLVGKAFSPTLSYDLDQKRLR